MPISTSPSPRNDYINARHQAAATRAACPEDASPATQLGWLVEHAQTPPPADTVRTLLLQIDGIERQQLAAALEAAFAKKGFVVSRHGQPASIAMVNLRAVLHTAQRSSW